MRALILACVLAPCAAFAQMYKWVDEKGVTHYSETLPPGAKGAKIDIKPATGDPGPVPAPDWKQKEMDARQQRIQKEQKEEKDRAEQQNSAAERRNRCLRSQRELFIVQSQRPVYQINEKGEKVYIDDKEREREIAGWQANVKRYCD